MQQPTCVDLRIRSIDDALKLFTAVRIGLLHMISRRLNEEERFALRAGCIYVWEERPQEVMGVGGIERFTEGRKWFASRPQDEFLYYQEKYSSSGLKYDCNITPYEGDWVPLIKQTYSVLVETENGLRKWHLTAYFTKPTLRHLGTVDDIPRIRELPILKGMFKTSRLGKNHSSKNRFQQDMRSLDVSLTAMRQSPIAYDIPCLSPQENADRQYRAYSSEQPLPSNLHPPSMGLPNLITSTPPRHSNGYYPDSELRFSSDSQPYFPSSTSAVAYAQSENAEKDSFGHAYQAPAPVNSSIPLYSTPYPLNSEYTPIALPTLAISNPPIHGMRLSSIPERSNGIQYPQGPSPIFPVESLTMQNHPTSFVRTAVSAPGPLNVIHKPIHHRPVDEDEMFLQMLRASQENPIRFFEPPLV